MKRYEELINKALELLADDGTFVEAVNELDSWDGFADGYRAYDMSELDELTYGMTVSKFLEQLTGDFNINDNYFFWSIYGIESCDDIAELYRSHTDAGEVLDNLVDNYTNVYFWSKELEEVVTEIAEYDEDEEAEDLDREEIRETAKALTAEDTAQA